MRRRFFFRLGTSFRCGTSSGIKTSASVPPLILLILFALSLSCSSGEVTKQGNLAPDFTLTALDGREVRLSDHRGKVVILDFWATWCKPCKLELPHFIELYKDYGQHDLEIIGVSLDRTGVRELVAFVEEWKIPYTIVIGTSEVVQNYGGIRGIPTTFVIDKQGNIFRKYVGYREKAVFERDILKLMEPVATVAGQNNGGADETSS
ncbi:MAG: redoxin domain-containing protein [Candidatus Eiseniibacteriota bacterium]|nr:MAG: redoxin domain-containing protein [Candidatus Eisenbacteria bacterium]